MNVKACSTFKYMSYLQRTLGSIAHYTELLESKRTDSESLAWTFFFQIIK